MATNPGSYGSGSTAAPTASTTTPAASSSTSSGSFPTTPSGQGLGVNGIQVANISVNDFLSNYDISSTEENTYLTNNNGKIALNENALMLMQYEAMSPADRQNIQQDLVNAGLLSAADADGASNSASLTAFKGAITNAQATGTDVNSYLQQYQGTNYAEGLVSNAISTEQKEAEQPTTATLENPTTLAADITSAFDQALGFSPTADEVNTFISQVQGQDTANAQAPHQAALQELTQLRSDQSQLSKMGPDDIDSIISAYVSTIHGAEAPGAGTQGPTTGTLPGGQVATTPLPGTPATAAHQVTTQEPTTYGVSGAIKHNIGAVGGAILGALHGNLGDLVNTPGIVTPGTQHGTHAVTRTVPGTPATPNLTMPSTNPAAIVAAGNQPAGPFHGGYYALTPADWSEAQKLTPAAQKYTTPGAAPQTVQLSAFTNLLQNLYDNNGGSWTDALMSVAGGTPKAAKTEDVPGTKLNLQTFATGVVSQVNQKLTDFENTVQNQSVTTKTTQPDAAAEAAQAAKQADPVGYYSANFASFGGLLSKMLYGTPLTEMENTSDTFTGPVGSDGALTGGTLASTPSSTPTNVPTGTTASAAPAAAPAATPALAATAT